MTDTTDVTLWVLHNPYPDGGWRGAEKCLGSEHVDIVAFYSKSDATEYRSTVGANHFVPVMVTMTLPAVGFDVRRHPRWTWVPGMAYTRRGKVHRVDGEFLASGGWYDETCTPKLDDPATIGCLTDLVRRAWDDSSVVATRTVEGDWVVTSGSHSFRGDTEGEALIKALDAAPRAEEG
jgi:hypothetical protein